VLDHIRTKAQHFIEERARHRAEAVAAHLGGGMPNRRIAANTALLLMGRALVVAQGNT
jgi:hypothetical protein